MLNKFSHALLLSILFSIAVSNFAVELNQKTNNVYSIGTGLSFNYKDDSLGFMIDSYHLFHFQLRPSDKLLVKLGFGFNYNNNPIIDQMNVNLTFTTSLGYLYILSQSHQLSHLKKFGVGFTIDYTMINTTTHGVGATIYTLVNPFLLGLGGGFVLSSNVDFQPYIMSSVGFTF